MNNKYLLIYLLILTFIIIFIYYTFYVTNQKNIKKDNIKLVKHHKIKCNGENPKKNDTKLYDIYIGFDKNRDFNEYLTKNKNNSSSIGPANMFIIRHAERIKNDIPLNKNGILRSILNIDLIDGLNDLGYGIDYIVTVNPDLNLGNMHMQQSVFLISWILNIPLFIFGSDREPELSVSEVYKHMIFNNKNVLFCWQHTCIQQLISSIIKIGPSVKKIPNQAFLNKNGKLELPHWGKNDFQTIVHIDESFKAHIYASGIKTCDKLENEHINLGKPQICKSNTIKLNCQ